MASSSARRAPPAPLPRGTGASCAGAWRGAPAPPSRDLSRAERAAERSASGDSRQDRQLGAVLDRRGQAVEKADVLARDVDVDEAPQRAVVVIDARAQLVVADEQRLEHLAHVCAVDLGLGLATGRGTKLRGNLDADRHQARTPAPSAASKAATVGAIEHVSNVPRTASSVLRPSPVMTSTTRSSRSMSPRSASLRSTAVVTPPAVSVKIPVVWASSAMPSRIS